MSSMEHIGLTGTSGGDWWDEERFQLHSSKAQCPQTLDKKDLKERGPCAVITHLFCLIDYYLYNLPV